MTEDGDYNAYLDRLVEALVVQIAVRKGLGARAIWSLIYNRGPDGLAEASEVNDEAQLPRPGTLDAFLLGRVLQKLAEHASVLVKGESQIRDSDVSSAVSSDRYAVNAVRKAAATHIVAANWINHVSFRPRQSCAWQTIAGHDQAQLDLQPAALGLLYIVAAAGRHGIEQSLLEGQTDGDGGSIENMLHYLLNGKYLERSTWDGHDVYVHWRFKEPTQEVDSRIRREPTSQSAEDHGLFATVDTRAELLDSAFSTKTPNNLLPSGDNSIHISGNSRRVYEFQDQMRLVARRLAGDSAFILVHGDRHSPDASPDRPTKRPRLDSAGADEQRMFQPKIMDNKTAFGNDDAIETSVIARNRADTDLPNDDSASTSTLTAEELAVFNKLLWLELPGLYLNPPSKFPVTRGRPRKKLLAIIKSAKLQSLQWFRECSEGDKIQYAPCAEHEEGARPYVADSRILASSHATKKRNNGYYMVRSAERVLSTRTQAQSQQTFPVDPARLAMSTTFADGKGSNWPVLALPQTNMPPSLLGDDPVEAVYQSAQNNSQHNFDAADYPHLHTSGRNTSRRRSHRILQRDTDQVSSPRNLDAAGGRGLDRTMVKKASRRLPDKIDVRDLRKKAMASVEISRADAVNEETTVRNDGNTRNAHSPSSEQHHAIVKRSINPHRRAKIIMSIVRRAGGVYPGEPDIWYTYIEVARRENPGIVPYPGAVHKTIDGLVQAGKLKKVSFTIQDSRNIITTRTIFCSPRISATGPKVTECRQAMQAAFPNRFIPRMIEPFPDDASHAANQVPDTSQSTHQRETNQGRRTNSPTNEIFNEEEPSELRQTSPLPNETTPSLRSTEHGQVIDKVMQIPNNTEFRSQTHTTLSWLEDEWTVPASRQETLREAALAAEEAERRIEYPRLDSSAWTVNMDRSMYPPGEQRPGFAHCTSMTDPVPQFHASTGTFASQFASYRRIRPKLRIDTHLHRQFEQSIPSNLQSLIGKSTLVDDNGDFDMQIRAVAAWEEENVSRLASGMTLIAPRFINHFVPKGQFHNQVGPLVTGGGALSNHDMGSTKRRKLEPAHGKYAPSTSVLSQHSETNRQHFQNGPIKLNRKPVKPHTPLQPTIDTPPVTDAVQEVNALQRPLRKAAMQAQRIIADSVAHHQDQSEVGSSSESLTDPSSSVSESPIQETPMQRTSNNKTPKIYNDSRVALFRVVAAAVLSRLLRTDCIYEPDWRMCSLIVSNYDPANIASIWEQAQSYHTRLIDWFDSILSAALLRDFEDGKLDLPTLASDEKYDWKMLFVWARRITHTPPVIVQSDLIHANVDEPDVSRVSSSVNNPNGRSDMFADIKARKTVRSSMSLGSDIYRNNLSQARTRSLDIPCSIIRANALTPRSMYNGDNAFGLIDAIPEAITKAALHDLVSRKVLRPNHAATNGQLNRRSHVIGVAFELAFRKFCKPKMLLEAASYKEILDSELFSSNRGAISESRVQVLTPSKPSAAQMMVLASLLAHDRICIAPALGPPTTAKDPSHLDVVAGQRSLSIWGYGFNSYRPRDIALDKLVVPLNIIPKASYAKGAAGLDSSLPPPTTIPGQPLPLWRSIHGHLLKEQWDRYIAAVLSVVASSPYPTMSSIAAALGPQLEWWDLDYAVEWLLATGTVSGDKKSRLTLHECWWMVLGTELYQSTAGY